jgi:threonine dehydrogenase-like Zn-dependent dehydrogenase
MSAGRVIAVDKDQSRLEMARAQGAEVINFDEVEPVRTIMKLTGNIGVDRVIERPSALTPNAHTRAPPPKRASRWKASSRLS